ncbi:hypothetical protein KIN20_030045 [Parelaphostrongylus tenuis]|uniref:Uncharacterized protein n=1 Tax=Parelaphostrongylus tenuis TaxID=148309 RepID=A0AAD5R3E7_PARTN|nr:hypothetical protein KIN20_030045 [Parelaphostrongylus tenuis]
MSEHHSKGILQTEDNAVVIEKDDNGGIADSHVLRAISDLYSDPVIELADYPLITCRRPSIATRKQNLLVCEIRL